jgi:hypothetical protein
MVSSIHITIDGYFGLGLQICKILEYVLSTAIQLTSKCQWFSPGAPVSSINETEPYDITEILLKVALITINLFHYDISYIVSKKHMYVLYFC